MVEGLGCREMWALGVRGDSLLSGAGLTAPHVDESPQLEPAFRIPYGTQQHALKPKP